jgi:hypothetical protein
MSIREASPLDQYPTLPAGSDVLTTSCSRPSILSGLVLSRA